MNELALFAGAGGGILGGNFSDGEQSAPLSGNHTQLAYLPPDKMTGFSRLSRFGMTFKPLTESRGEELLTLYLEDFHAKTYPQQEKERELTESEAECGKRWHGLLAKYDQDSCSWKTLQCSLLGDLELYSETWPRWGTMQNGESFLRQIPALRTCENESGLWQTPTVTQINLRSDEAWEKKKVKREATGRQTLPPGTLQEQVMMSKETPCWDWNKSPMNPKNKMWPTPTAHNAKETNAPSEANRNTPTLASQAGGQLNPTWVEWLMGWPLGWTDLKRLETDKFQEWLQQHLSY